MTSLWLDEKYLRLLSPQLDNFKQKHPHVFNFRCPLCGDSERVRSKTRGFCYALQNKLMFKCHNCSVALPFTALLKRMSSHLYHEFLLESLKDTRHQEAAPEPVAAAEKGPVDLSLVAPLDSPRIAQGPCKLVRDYVLGRGIPQSQIGRLFATNRAFSWLAPLVGEDKAKRVTDGEIYLVFPMRLPDGTWYGVQVRPLTKKDYITFRWSHEGMKVFGMECWNPKKPTYIVEGPLDALFVPNALAALGSDLFNAVQSMEDAGFKSPLDSCVYVWDNEPRNKEVARNVGNAVKLRLSVVIWPREYPKDINDMQNAGIDVNAVLSKRTFKGLMAELEYTSWRQANTVKDTIR